MYKLVAVGGKIRGQEFVLKNGDNVFGRGSDCDVALSLDGVSKKHFKIVIHADNIYIEDQGSSNGTLVNGKLVKSIAIENGDKIAIPGSIFQLVYVKEKKILIRKNLGGADSDDDYEPMPADLGGKVLYLFKNKLMSPIFKINEEYEWSVMVGIFLSIFIALNIGITILPILADHKSVLLTEVALRANHYADEIGRLNKTALAQNDLERVDTNFLDNENGVKYYELFDPNGRIVRPVQRMNEYTHDPFSAKAKSLFKKDSRRNTLVEDRRGTIYIAKRIKAYIPSKGSEVWVGVIAITFAPDSWVYVTTSNLTTYFRAFLISIVVGSLLFGIIFYLTIVPINDLNKQLENFLRGKDVELNNPRLFKYLNPLRENIKTLLQRIAESENMDGDGGFGEMEEDGPYVERLGQILEGISSAAIVLNSEKNIEKMNMQAEDLTGIRETAAQGENILDVAKEKGFAATVIDLCDQSASEEGRSQQGEYELQGRNYEIFASGLVGKDNFVKAFILTFNLDE